MKKPHTILDPSRQGVVMMSMMVLFGIMTIMTVAVFIVAKTDVEILTQYKRGQTAFFNAEAALQFAKSKIEEDLQSGSLNLDSETESVYYTSPSEVDFEPIQKLSRLADPAMYSLSVTGNSENAHSVIEAAFKQRNLLLNLGIFGNEIARIQPHVSVNSYRSDLTSIPVHSTGEAGVGSNEKIIVQPNVMIDGVIMLGQDILGNEATGPASLDYTVEDIGERVSPDPLGANGGELEEATVYYRNPANNNNLDAVPSVNNNSIRGSVYLPPGNYYISSFNIGAHETLEIGGTPENPVNIFLESNGNASFRMQPNSSIMFTSGTPSPSAFRMYSISDNPIWIQPNLDFRGLIYAPNSEVRIQPNNDFYGAVWGNEILLQPGANFWVDMSLLNQYKSTTIEYTQWKEVRNR